MKKNLIPSLEILQTRIPPDSFPKVLWAVPLLLAVVIGLFTIDGGFVQDDYAAIKMNPIVTKDLPYQAFRRDFWGTPLDKKILAWRPLLPLIWKLLWNIQPDSPLLYRILSLLFHVVATGSVLWLGRRLIKEKEVLWATGIFFAVHAVHSEALGSLVSQADILSTLLGLLAISMVLSPLGKVVQAVLSGIFLVLACLAKESAVIFGVVIIFILIVQKEKTLKKRLCIIVPVTVIVIFFYCLPIVSGPQHLGRCTGQSGS